MASQSSVNSESFAVNLHLTPTAASNSGNLQIRYASNCRKLVGTLGSGFYPFDELFNYLSIPAQLIHVPPQLLLCPEWHRFYLKSAIASLLNLSDTLLRVTVADHISSYVLLAYQPSSWFMGYFMTVELCFIHEIFFDQTSYINSITDSFNEMTSLSETDDDDDEDLAPNGGGASRSAFNRLIEKGSFVASKSDQELGMCSICLEEFASSNKADHYKLLRMDCSHVYHHACILPWLHRSNTCPKCRRRVD